MKVNTKMLKIILIAILCLGVTLASESCKLDKEGFKNCVYSRKAAIDCLFESFGEGEGDNRYLDGKWIYKAWDKFFLPAEKHYAHDNPDNVVGQCDADGDKKVYRPEFEITACKCLKNCFEVAGALRMCARVKEDPNWRYD